MILVDSSVLIDLLEDQPRWRTWSEEALLRASSADDLAINVLIYAEISRSFASVAKVDAFLRGTGIALEAIPAAAAFAAARAHQAYRATGGARTATLPDFFIGAHAAVAGWPLMTRDAKRVRTYFPGLELITPTPG